MDRSALGAFFLLVACGGCRMCSDCCDYLPPVVNGEHAIPGHRAGSAFGTAVGTKPFAVEQIPDSSESEAFETLPTVDPDA